MKRRKSRGVYFINRPAPTERAWLLEHGATEEDLAFADLATDPVAGLFPDAGLRDRYGALLATLRAASGRFLLHDEKRGTLYRGFAGVGPADRLGDHPEGLVLVRRPDARSRIPGLADDAPGVRDLVAFYRGGLGALLGGDETLGLALPAEVQSWSRVRKHNLDQVDFLPEHRTRNFRLFWDQSDGTELIFDATGKVYAYRGGSLLEFRYDTVGRFLEEGAMRIATGVGAGEIDPGRVDAIAPAHPLGAVALLRSGAVETLEVAEARALLRRAESSGWPRETIADLSLALLRREERWADYVTEMRRTVLGPFRSLVDRPDIWTTMAQALAALSRSAEFRDIARQAAAGPLRAESRGALCDHFLAAEDVEAAVGVLERSMQPGRELEPALADRIARLKSYRPRAREGRTSPLE